VADYSQLFRENPNLLAQALAAAQQFGAAGSSSPMQQPPPVEQAPPPPPVEPPPQQAPAPAPPPAFDPSTMTPMPASPELQADIDAALAQQQAQPPTPMPAGPPPAEAPPPAPSGQIDMRIAADAERPTGPLGRQQQQLLDESVAAGNEAGDSFAREGDAKALAASEAAKVYGTQAGLADRYARAAEANYGNHQARAARYRQMEDEDFERLQQEPPKPGHLKSIFNVISGIIGAAAGGEQGAAIGMLRQHVNRQAEEDAQERMAAQNRIEVSGKIQDRILHDSANEFDAAAKLVAGQWIVASRHLEQIANESNVPAFREQAFRLSVQAKDQARGLLKQNVEAQAQQAEAQAAAQAKARAASSRTKWEDMSQAELEALQRAGLLPAPQAEKLADLQIKQRKASGEEDSAVARSNIKQEAAKSLRLYDSAERDAMVLRDMISKLDAEGSNDVPGVGPIAGLAGDWLISAKGVRVRQATKKVLKAQLRDESGAAISDDELEAFMDDRGMGQNATNADFLAGARVALQEFEQKRAIARQAAGIGDGASQPESSNYAEIEARLGARPEGAP
jgi:hypothetical protein